MIWEVYAYWNNLELQGIFNAVAMLTGSGDYLDLIGTIFLVGIFAAGLAVLLNPKDSIAPWRWMAISVLLYSILLVPKTDVAIIDRTGTTPAVTVPNVPISLAVLGHMTSKIGDWLTTSYETTMQVISPSYATPGVNFVGNGLLFGHKIIQEASALTPASSSFQMNMDTFFSKCVFPEFDTGNISPEDVFTSNDLWAEVSNVNPGIYVNLYAPDGSAMPAPVDCVNAYNALTTSLTTQANTELGRIAQKLYPDQSSALARNSLDASLAGTYGYYASTAESSLDIFRQRLATNTFLNATNSDSTTVYAKSQAESTSRTNYSVLSEIAQTTIPKLRNVAEVIIYSVFPIVLIIMVIAGDKALLVIKNYLVILMSIQLWAPLYAVINYLVASYRQKEILASTDPTNALSVMYSNVMNAGAQSDLDIAGMLAMSIPVLALAIMKGGEMAMTSAMSNLTAPASQAASMASKEAAMGNLSAGNVSLDNSSYNTQSANKQDLRADVDHGAATTTTSDNRQNSHLKMASGNSYTVTDSTGAESKGAENNYKVASAQEQRAQQSYSQAQTAVQTATTEAAQGSTQITSDVLSQTQGYDAQKVASFSTTVGNKEMAAKGLEASQQAQHSIENIDGYSASDSSKLTGYVMSELKGGASLQSIFETGLHAGAGVKADVGLEHKAEEVFKDKFANIDQQTATETLALQDEIATSKDLRGAIGFNDTANSNISAASQEQTSRIAKVSAAEEQRKEAKQELSEAQARKEEATLGISALLGNEAYTDAGKSWITGQGQEYMNQIAMARMNGNSEEVANLSQQARLDYQEYTSTNNFVGNQIMPQTNSMPGSPPTADTTGVNAAHDANQSGSGYGEVRSGISGQIDGRGAALDVAGKDVQADYTYQKQGNDMQRQDMQPESHQVEKPASSVGGNMLNKAKDYLSEEKNSNPNGEQVKAGISGTSYEVTSRSGR